MSQLLSQAIEFDQAGRFRLELGQKMVFAQLKLAADGYSTGGRAPYAFDRWLVRIDGTIVRQLAEGERVRMEGHHVVWLPGSDGRMEVALRIRQMLSNMSAVQVAQRLNAEGIPSPDAGRHRTDGGVRHPVSGKWNSTSIVNLGRCPLYAAIVRHGARSMGDQVRFTPDGPRLLSDEDYRPDGKPKVIQNPAEQQIRATGRFTPLVTSEDHMALQETLDRRAGTQKGKPRSRDPNRNPLGCRVFDMACGWPMYRVARKQSFNYSCGLYQQSHGDQCAHNHVDGLQATRFALSCISQVLASPKNTKKLRRKLEQLAAQPVSVNTAKSDELMVVQSRLRTIREELELVGRNLARAKDDDQYNLISQQYSDLKLEQQRLQQRESALNVELSSTPKDRAGEIAAVLKLVDRLHALANTDHDLSTARELSTRTNCRLFLRFAPVQCGKRMLNRLQGGVVTFGDAVPPVTIYEGPTSRKQLSMATTKIATVGETSSPTASEGGGEIESSRNRNRDRAQLFEPIQALAATCVREYPVDRPPQLRFLARLVDEELAP